MRLRLTAGAAAIVLLAACSDTTPTATTRPVQPPARTLLGPATPTAQADSASKCGTIYIGSGTAVDCTDH